MIAWRCLATAALLVHQAQAWATAQAGAFLAPSVPGGAAASPPLRQLLLHDGGSAAASLRPRTLADAGAAGSQPWSSAICLAAVVGAATALAGAKRAWRRQSACRNPTRFGGITMCRAHFVVGADDEDEVPEGIYYGQEDPETGKKNYVNPWEQRVKEDLEAIEKGEKPGGKLSGHRFHKYTGPVYKRVPVAEGLQFPLDPKMYYPPLEPPPPGAKWGDGRSPDGNWYMDVDGERTQYWMGLGKRKVAAALVRIYKGEGNFLINGREAIEYFLMYPPWWMKSCEPICALNEKNNFDIVVKAFGGGYSGQAGAIRMGLARALEEYNFSWRPLLKKAKYLTRDWRMSEPKKTGKPKARKSKPYHKR